MDEFSEPHRYGTSEELIAYLRERMDDIDSVVIPVQSKIQVSGPQGGRRVMARPGAWIKLCRGDSMVISREDAAMLINDGVLQRLGIKCVLDPLE